MNDVLCEWKQFFAPGKATEERVFRVVRRKGRPMLLLPPNARAAALSLGFYPAQTWLARTARTALRMALSAHVPVPLYFARLPWNASAPLPAFFREQADSASYDSGILLGNPNAEGRRWIIGLIVEGRVVRVVKAGVTKRAVELIAAEEACLNALPASAAAIPKVRGTLEGDVSAIALDFAPGDPPSRNSSHEIQAILTTWLDRERDVALDDVPAWRAVRESAADPAAATRIGQELGAAPFGATIMHGDFAPWNIRVSDGKWTVLDWERGAMIGVPGWDWLHYAIQCDVLVARRAPSKILSRTQSLMRSTEFQEFAKCAKIAGRERALLAGYLLHAVHVLKQTEGTKTMTEMLRIMALDG